MAIATGSIPGGALHFSGLRFAAVRWAPSGPRPGQPPPDGPTVAIELLRAPAFDALFTTESQFGPLPERLPANYERSQ
jgi:hypothetical protein